jgi:hypothetical protein
LNGAAKVQIQIAGVGLKRASDAEARTPRESNNLVAQAEGYNCWSVKLGYGMVHCLFIARTPGFVTR